MNGAQRFSLLDYPGVDLSAHFDARAELYDDAAPWVRDTIVLDAIAAELRLQPRMRVLDLAAGTGVVARHLLEIEPTLDVTALDISEAMLSKLTHPRVSKMLSDAHFIDVPSGFFNVIVCRQGFHYFERPSVVLHQCKRLLVSGGNFLIAQITPFGAVDCDHWETIIRIKQPLRHHCWTLDTLDAAITDAGFLIRGCVQLKSQESLRSWLDRYEHSEQQRAELERLHYEAPSSYKNLHNFHYHDKDITFDVCWTIISATARADDI